MLRNSILSKLLWDKNPPHPCPASQRIHLCFHRGKALLLHKDVHVCGRNRNLRNSFIFMFQWMLSCQLYVFQIYLGILLRKFVFWCMFHFLWQISSCHNGMMFGASTQALTFAPLKAHMVKRKQQVGGQTVCQAAVAADRVPDMGKRNLMNLLLLGAISLPSAGLIGPYLYFFVPPRYIPPPLHLCAWISFFDI